MKDNILAWEKKLFETPHPSYPEEPYMWDKHDDSAPKYLVLLRTEYCHDPFLCGALLILAGLSFKATAVGALSSVVLAALGFLLVSGERKKDARVNFEHSNEFRA